MPVTKLDVKNIRLRQALQAAGISAIMTCNVALFAPFEVYVGNPVEFTAPLNAILGLYAVPAVLFVILLALIGAAIPRAGFPRYLSALAAIAVAMWLQGTFMVWDYGVFDGSPIAWLEQGWRGLIDTTVWLLLLVLGLYGYTRFGRSIIFAAVASFAIQAISITSGLLLGADTGKPYADGTAHTSRYDAMRRFSMDRNVLHVVMDGFQSDIFASIVGDPENANLVAALDGFTFFEQHTGTFPYTQMTVPLIVSGKTYTNEIPVDDFTRDALEGETILNAVEEAGYEVDIATQAPLGNVYTMGDFTNYYSIPQNRHASRQDYVLSDGVRLVDLALFRVTPHFVKAYIYQDDLWFIQSYFRTLDFMDLRYFSDLRFLDDVASDLSVDREKRVYKLFHLMLSHKPTVGNKDCEFDGIRATNRENVSIQARCGLAAVSRLLESMQRSGIYDKSLIVLMADHGAWVPVAGHLENDPDVDAPGALIGSMALPVLAVKPPGAGGPIKTSQAPTAMVDVPTTIADLLGVKDSYGGYNVFEMPEQMSRRRLFYTYIYGRNKESPGYLYPMAEYEIIGTPYDYKSWRKLGVRHPEGHPVP
jgi:hypothetical protein